MCKHYTFEAALLNRFDRSGPIFYQFLVSTSFKLCRLFLFGRMLYLVYYFRLSRKHASKSFTFFVFPNIKSCLGEFFYRLQYCTFAKEMNVEWYKKTFDELCWNFELHNIFELPKCTSTINTYTEFFLSKLVGNILNTV